jgi:hypothetical protein
MAVFSTNQNRQFYVAVASVTSEPATLGDLKIGSTDDNKIFFKYLGKGGLLRSDLIDKASITYARVTRKAELQRKLKQAVITVDAKALDEGNLIAGQDYIVRIYIHNYLAPGDAHTAIKYGAVHATAGMKPAQFYTELAKSLTQNFSREATPLLTFTAAESGVTVKEVEQPWAQDTVNFEIVPASVLVDGDEVLWATTNGEGKVAVTDSATIIGNGKKIADLEYFCMGERGDQYRKVAGINALPVEYMVDPTKDYDVLDIHYSFSDTGVNVQKSEKHITIVGESKATGDVISAIKAKLTASPFSIAVTEKVTAE